MQTSKFSTSHGIKIKITMRYHDIFTGMTKIKKSDIIEEGAGVEQLLLMGI